MAPYKCILPSLVSTTKDKTFYKFLNTKKSKKAFSPNSPACRMLSTVFLGYASFFSLGTTAFMVSTYETLSCTAAGATQNLTTDSGCQNKLENLASIRSDWDNEMDNKVIIALYDDDNCCHASKLQTVTWTDGCFKVMTGAKSLRVVDPRDPEKGKSGEVYTC
jgi:hypothetical protein